MGPGILGLYQPQSGYTAKVAFSRLLLPSAVVIAAMLPALGVVLAALVVLIDVGHKNEWSVLKFTGWLIGLLFLWIAVAIYAA